MIQQQNADATAGGAAESACRRVDRRARGASSAGTSASSASSETPVEREGVTVIPVATARFGFGGGTGSDPEKKQEGEGAGAGGTMSPPATSSSRTGAAASSRSSARSGWSRSRSSRRSSHSPSRVPRRPPADPAAACRSPVDGPSGRAVSHDTARPASGPARSRAASQRRGGVAVRRCRPVLRRPARPAASPALLLSKAAATARCHSCAPTRCVGAVGSPRVTARRGNGECGSRTRLTECPWPRP